MDSVYKIPQLIGIPTGENTQEQGKKVGRKQLINKLNYINFQDGTILVHFKHVKYKNTLNLLAKPHPCQGDQLDCYWTETTGLKQKLPSYKFENFFVSDDQKLLLVEPELLDVDEERIRFRLPETCFEVRARRVNRNHCEGIQTRLIQHSAAFRGSLVDFSPISFRVDMTAAPPQTFNWINPQSPVNIQFSADNETIYSGDCRIIKQSHSQTTKTFVLEPLQQQIRRFKPKEFRSKRRELVPSPNIMFKHPLTRKTIDLKVLDLSGSGFSVEEDYDSAVLLPGMIIPKLELNFANSFSVTFRAQVIYRNEATNEAGERHLKCGMAILDIAVEEHVKLLALLHQVADRHSYVCNRVDIDALWNFFFETGFIYPQKYEFIKANRDKFKEIYEKLYTSNPHIARHFIYQDKGNILGHMAMVRFYENSWLIHHHASKKAESNRAGISVLHQIGRSINDSHNLYSAKMNFVFCFFRPDNKFPSRVFGGVSRYMKEPKGCSLDTFAYLHYQRKPVADLSISEPWTLAKSTPEDLMELENFYENESGGLMITAMDLEPSMAGYSEITLTYQKLGFKREKHLFSLKNAGNLKAVIIVNIADVGLNMSELTNSIKVIVLDADELPRVTLFQMLSLIATKFDRDDIPVLMYPVHYAQRQSIPHEKLYTMWVLNLQYLDPYFKYCETLFRRI